MPLIYRDKGTSGTQLTIYSHEFCIGHVGKEFMSIMTNQPGASQRCARRYSY